MCKESTTRTADTSTWLTTSPDFAPIPCTSWCRRCTPVEEVCFGPERCTPLSLEARQHNDDGWSVKYLGVYAFRDRTYGQPAAVSISIGEDRGWHLTPTEARTLAATLVAAAEEAERA
mgnify:CR=1 FL=1